jgi:hypothetical protein
MLKTSKKSKEEKLLSLLEYSLEYREERKRMDRQFKAEIEKSLSFMGM